MLPGDLLPQERPQGLGKIGLGDQVVADAFSKAVFHHVGRHVLGLLRIFEAGDQVAPLQIALHLGFGLAKIAFPASLQELFRRPIRQQSQGRVGLRERHAAALHRPQKGQIRLALGQDQPRQTVKLLLVIVHHQFALQQRLIGLVPALQLKQRVLKGLALQIFFLFRLGHGAGDGLDLGQRPLIEVLLPLLRHGLGV